nr:hypothetical protein BaRGS_029476 [Batillaria attramentaria]
MGDPLNQQSVKKMFVGGLKDDTTEEQIRECFSGNITEVEMIKDKMTGKSRGFCFVTFDDTDTVGFGGGNYGYGGGGGGYGNQGWNQGGDYYHGGGGYGQGYGGGSYGGGSNYNRR